MHTHNAVVTRDDAHKILVLAVLQGHGTEQGCKNFEFLVKMILFRNKIVKIKLVLRLKCTAGVYHVPITW